MIFKNIILCLSLSFLLTACSQKTLDSQNELLPIGKLDSRILNQYYPLILKELEGDTALQDDKRTKRETREYGYSFFKMMEGDHSYTSPPPFLIELGNEVCKALNKPPQDFSNFILSLYEPGYHLEPHFDMDETGLPQHGFAFGEDVFGLIIEPDSTGHLYFVYYDGPELVPPLNLKPIYSLKEEVGTVFVMKGKLRHHPYHHGVTDISKRRISVTFRTVKFRDKS